MMCNFYFIPLSFLFLFSFSFLEITMIGNFMIYSRRILKCDQCASLSPSWLAIHFFFEKSDAPSPLSFIKEGQMFASHKQEKGRRETHEDTECNNNATRCQNYLELRLGMSLTNGLEAEDGKGSSYEGGTCPRYLTTQDGLVIHQRNGTGLGGSKRGFSEITGGFVHPWSLAARQEKAALEQAHQKSSHFSTVTRVVHPPQLVGWPPVRSFRRNLGVQNQSKSKMNSEPNVEEIKIAEKESMHNELQERPTMFVKVNIEGCTVGRKIDLKLYNGYDSLSHALQKLFRNFLYVNYLNNPKQDEPDAVTSPSYILLYEDNEGDRMLVGDVPWELFISSVKRLYITLDPRSHTNADCHEPSYIVQLGWFHQKPIV